MIRGPSPGFIARPIPTGVSALPSAITIRTPLGINAAGNPAAPVRADDFPSPVRTEWLIKIILAATHHPDRARRKLHLDGWRRYIDGRRRLHVDDGRRNIRWWRWRHVRFTRLCH